MKKITALFLALTLALSLVSCGSGGAGTSNPPVQSGNPSGEGKTLKAALVLDGPIDDGGWNADCYNGLVRCQDELGYEIAYSENVAQSDYVSAAREYAAAGYDLVILPGNQFQDAAIEIHEEFPDVHFAGINFSYTASNVSAMAFNDLQSGFMAGAFAALMSKTGAVGYIGGTEIQSIVDCESGFMQGAKYINPDITAVSSMTGSWSDVAKGKELALAQISTSNVDVIFGFASACNSGMIAACKEQGRLYIAEPLDILGSEPGVIIGSVLEMNSELIVTIAEMVAQGVTEGQSIVGDISNGILSYGAFADEVPAEVQTRLEEICAGLVDGSIPVTAE